jgi:hypothetical protein
MFAIIWLVSDVKVAKLIDIDLIALDREPVIPCAVLDNEDLEMPIPERRPDVIVDPFDFEQDVHNKDYRYHRLPMGVLGRVDVDRIMTHTLGDWSQIVTHGDGKGEGLLFPVLYPHGCGFWRYQHSTPLLLRSE